MACRECVYFFHKRDEMICSRFPTHMEVDPLHFCGEMKIKIEPCYYTDGSEERPKVDHYFQRMQNANSDRMQLHEENISLRKEIKSLRDLYKATTGKSAIVRKPKS